MLGFHVSINGGGVCGFVVSYYLVLASVVRPDWRVRLSLMIEFVRLSLDWGWLVFRNMIFIMYDIAHSEF